MAAPAFVDSSYVAFVGLALLITITPGPDFALVTRQVIVGGRRAGAQAVAGIFTGHVVHIALSIAGLSALVAQSQAAFTVVRTLGAAYLLYLGVRALLSTWGRRADDASEVGPTDLGTSRSSAYRQGLLSNLLNPKIVLMYFTFLPQFINPGDPVVARSLLLAATMVAIGLAWFAIYLWAMGAVRALLQGPRARRAVDRVTGCALVAFGLRLSASAR